MRGITLSLVVALVMSSVALATPTLNYEVTNYYPGSGVRTFTVYATGLNINTLAAFNITGVNQVWTAPYTMSEWVNSPNTPANPVDSYVMFGHMRLPDIEAGPGAQGPFTTDEVFPGSTTGATSGVGTLVNGTANPDAYVKLGVPLDVESRVDLFRLAVPKGQAAVVTATLHSALLDDDNVPWYTDIKTYRFDDEVDGLGSLMVKSVLDGDTNSDGIVNSTDLSLLLSSYNQSGKFWNQGDFNGDGNVNSTDLSLLLGNYNQAAAWYGSAAPAGEAAAGGTAIPEPGTLVMLVLGCLCLAGYRLRK